MNITPPRTGSLTDSMAVSSTKPRSLAVTAARSFASTSTRMIFDDPAVVTNPVAVARVIALGVSPVSIWRYQNGTAARVVGTTSSQALTVSVEVPVVPTPQ